MSQSQKMVKLAFKNEIGLNDSLPDIIIKVEKGNKIKNRHINRRSTITSSINQSSIDDKNAKQMLADYYEEAHK